MHLSRDACTHFQYAGYTTSHSLVNLHETKSFASAQASAQSMISMGAFVPPSRAPRMPHYTLLLCAGAVAGLAFFLERTLAS